MATDSLFGCGLLLLARHGQTNDNPEPIRVQGFTDTPLNEVGRRQAHELADRVARMDVASLWCSDLSRAAETAGIVGERIGREPRPDARLREGDRGDWEGRLFIEIEAEDPIGYAAWRSAGPGFRFPGGESLQEHSDRVHAALCDILTGGELPALVVCDAILRLLPGAIEPGSLVDESFTSGLLEYPQYTRPAVFEGIGIPEILTSGDHGAVRRWRLRESLRRTLERRPELLEGRTFSAEEARLLEEVVEEREVQGVDGERGGDGIGAEEREAGGLAAERNDGRGFQVAIDEQIGCVGHRRHAPLARATRLGSPPAS